MNTPPFDFPTAFTALRGRVRDGMDQAFTSTENVTVAGRMAALYSAFHMAEERKLFGIMPTGGTSHAHEYRLLFAAPGLTEQQVVEWWQYGLEAFTELVKPDRSHEFSIVSLILATESVNRAVVRKLRPLNEERKYPLPAQGWAALRMAIVDLSTHKVYTNRLGAPLQNILKPLVAG